jgi:putative methionine-R-sulfoxide reductase with GAF domain
MTKPGGFSWQRLVQQAEGLLGVSSNQISNAANLSAFLYQQMDDVSWVGFYFLVDETGLEAVAQVHLSSVV